MLVDVERLLEHKWQSIRHIETERYWWLAGYLVVVGGVLAFVGQLQDPNSAKKLAYPALAVGSFLGFLQAWRAGQVLRGLQNDTIEITNLWRRGLPNAHLRTAARFWSFGRSGTPGLPARSSEFYLNFFCFRRLKFETKDSRQISCLSVFFPPSFTTLHVWAYFGSMGVFSYLSWVSW